MAIKSRTWSASRSATSPVWGQFSISSCSRAETQVHGIAFEVSKADTLRNDARKAAIADARAKADLLAAAAGARVGRVLAIEEGGARAPQPRVYAAGRAAMAKSAAPPIEAGSQRLDAHVSVTWTLE